MLMTTNNLSEKCKSVLSGLRRNDSLKLLNRPLNRKKRLRNVRLCLLSVRRRRTVEETTI